MSVIRSRVVALSLVLSGVALAGCVREQKFTQRRARAWCEHAVDCGSFKSISDCMGASQLDDEDPYLEAAIDAGRIDYDARAARRCIRAIKRLKCYRDEDESEVEEECAGVFTGQVGPEEACYRGAECAGEASVCATVPNSCTADDSCCPGVCRYIPEGLEKGESCGGRASCGEGLYCPPATPEVPIRVCATVPNVGQACSSNVCEEGAFCQEGTCAAKREAGGSCDRDSACLSDYCNYDWMTDSGACTERSKTGGPCETSDGCLRIRDRCDDGTCVEPKLGDDCEDDYYADECPDFAFCHEGKCVRYSYEGDRCGDDGEACYGSLVCHEGAAFGRECAFLGSSSPGEESCALPE